MSRPRLCDNEDLMEQALDIIYRQPGITDNELANALGVSVRPTIKRIVSLLIRDGQIIRSFNQNDRRQIAYMQS